MRIIRRLGFGAVVALAVVAGGCFLIPNNPPIAEFEARFNTDPDPLIVVLDASASVDEDPLDEIAAYQWTFGEDVTILDPLEFSTTLTQPTISVRYPIEGEYTVTLVVWSGEGDRLKSGLTSQTFPLPNPQTAPTE